jgi:hypothetical protein
MGSAEGADPKASLSWAAMVRTLFILAVGASIGYVYGYKDAKTHDKTIVERTLDRAGAAAKGKYLSHVEQETDSVRP